MGNKIVMIFQGKRPIKNIIRYSSQILIKNKRKKATSSNIVQQPVDINDSYHYVFVAEDKDMGLYQYVLSDVNNLDRAITDIRHLTSPILNILFGFHTMKEDRKKSFLYKKPLMGRRAKEIEKTIEKKGFKQKKLCIILIGAQYCYPDYWLRDYLKSRLPEAKFCMFIIDQISVHPEYSILVNNHMKDYDLIYSYDRKMAQEYNLLFHNIPVSDLRQFIKQDIREEYDICFVGKAKNRFQKIIAVYEHCIGLGLRCCFYILWVSKSDYVYENDIHYNTPLSYYDYLKIAAKSKCLLEIVQDESTGNTLRVSEAVALDKLLLTDNQEIVENDIYEERYMKAFQETEEIKINFFQQGEIHYNDEIKKKIMPSEFLKDLEKEIQQLS